MQYLAAQGHETALAILRSKKVEGQPESAAAPAPPANPHDTRQAWDAQRMAILKTPAISNRHRRALLAVVKMRELLESEPGLSATSLSFKIDSKGTVIFTLPGGTIRDTGREVHCGAGNEVVRALATKLAQASYAKTVRSGAEKERNNHATTENKTDHAR